MAAVLLGTFLILVAGSDNARAAENPDVPTELKSVTQVRLDGYHQVPVKELWAAMKTRRPAPWPWHERPRLRLDFLRADTSAIASVCRQHGFLDARASFEILPGRRPDEARVRFHIHEGRRFRIRSVTWEGVRSIPLDPVRRHAYARPGRAFNPAYLVADTLRIERLYQDKSYLPRVASSYTRDSTEVTVRYVVTEGVSYRFGKTYLSSPGDLKVSDHLVRRELLTWDGEPFQMSRVERSIDRLYGTGLFSQAQITLLPDSARRVIEMDLRVRERKRRWIDGGVGSGSSERFRFTGEWGHRNLTGHGQQGVASSLLALDGTGDFQKWHNEVSLLEPWLLRTRIRGQVTGFYEQLTDRTVPQWTIRQFTRGVNFQLRRELDRYTTASLIQSNGYITQSFEFSQSDDPLLTVARRDSLKAETPPKYTTHRLLLDFERDSRDNPLDPNRGSVQSLIGEVAGGPLHGSSSFQKLQAMLAWYAPTTSGWVIGARLRAGAIDPFGTPHVFTLPDTTVNSRVAQVPLEDRFRIGGVNSVRGYSESSIPATGGLALLQANLEVHIPVLGPLGVELFGDAGNVWESSTHIRLSQFRPFVSHRALGADDVRYTFGFGPRIKLPIGPLRIDFAWSLRPTATGAALRANPQFAIGPSF